MPLRLTVAMFTILAKVGRAQTMQRDCTTERMQHFLWIALLVMCQASCSNADPRSNLALSRDASAVAGTVIDEHTGKPLGDAYVTLYLDSEQDAPLAFP